MTYKVPEENSMEELMEEIPKETHVTLGRWTVAGRHRKKGKRSDDSKTSSLSPVTLLKPGKHVGIFFFLNGCNECINSGEVIDNIIINSAEVNCLGKQLVNHKKEVSGNRFEKLLKIMENGMEDNVEDCMEKILVATTHCDDMAKTMETDLRNDDSLTQNAMHEQQQLLLETASVMAKSNEVRLFEIVNDIVDVSTSDLHSVNIRLLDPSFSSNLSIVSDHHERPDIPYFSGTTVTGSFLTASYNSNSEDTNFCNGLSNEDFTWDGVIPVNNFLQKKVLQNFHIGSDFTKKKI